MGKECIWCKKGELETSFNNQAHTIPKSLGGEMICENVCDSCNKYFGSYYQGLPPIETILKETFNISRARFLATSDGIGKNKPLSRFTSTYFKVDFKQSKIDIKTPYKFNSSFQKNISRQMKRGIYKMFLEEIERQTSKGHNPKYDFIREYSRWNIGDYPVFYFERINGLIIMHKDWYEKPTLLLKKDEQFLYLIQHPSFHEFEFMGHVFGIATSRFWELTVDDYLKESFEAKKAFFRRIRLVNYFNDIDLGLSIMDDYHRP